MKKKSILIGGVFGAVAPFFGIFLGLQVSTVLGNIFTAPFILLVVITDTPIGMMSDGMKWLGILLSAVLWAGIFVGFDKLREAQKKN